MLSSSRARILPPHRSRRRQRPPLAATGSRLIEFHGDKSPCGRGANYPTSGRQQRYAKSIGREILTTPANARSSASRRMPFFAACRPPRGARSLNGGSPAHLFSNALSSLCQYRHAVVKSPSPKRQYLTEKQHHGWQGENGRRDDSGRRAVEPPSIDLASPSLYFEARNVPSS